MSTTRVAPITPRPSGSGRRFWMKLSGAYTTDFKKIILWIAFSVLFSLSPLFVNYLVERDAKAFAWSWTIHRGELFLIAAALCADAFGRILSQRTAKASGVFPTVCLVACVFILFATSIEFGIVAPNLDQGRFLEPNQIRDSILVFFTSVVVGFLAIIVEVKNS